MKIGIDIGGSHIGIGLINDEFKIMKKLEENFTKEEKQKLKEILVSKIVKGIKMILEDGEYKLEDIELIGISCPGTVKDGVVLKAGNLNLENFEIIERLRDHIDTKIVIKNDGVCAAIAEKRLGSMRGYEDCIFTNLGTGIGGAIFIKGKLLEPKMYPGFEVRTYDNCKRW